MLSNYSQDADVLGDNMLSGDVLRVNMLGNYSQEDDVLGANVLGYYSQDDDVLDDNVLSGEALGDNMLGGDVLGINMLGNYSENADVLFEFRLKCLTGRMIFLKDWILGNRFWYFCFIYFYKSRFKLQFWT